MIITSLSNRYSFWDKLKLCYYFIKTKFIYPGQRLIRFPFHIRGRKMIKFGKWLTTGVGCRIEAFIGDKNNDVKIKLGNNIQLNDYVHVSAVLSVRIGDNVLMASHVYISDNSHGSYKGDQNDISPYIIPIRRPYYAAPVTIGDRAWLGEGVIVMPGVSIGNGAIIGAHSIVNNDVPDDCIAVGAPAKVIKQWNNETKRWQRYGNSVNSCISHEA